MRLVATLALACALCACGRTTPVRFPGGTGETPTGEAPLPPADPQPWPLMPELPPPPPPPICEGTGSEDFTVPPFQRRPIDVLFVIDDSGSMGNDQQALSENFQAFFGAFRAREVDFHLGAVTTDMSAANRSGRLVAPFLTQDTLDLERRFAQMVRPGTTGSASEQALGAARAALTLPLVDSANAGFMREEADLALVFLGDEDDQSSVDPGNFAAWLLNRKAPAVVTVGTIIVGRCSPNSVRDWRLARFARLFGSRGITRLCSDDYADTLHDISGRIVDGRCVVPLRHDIDDLRRVRVTVNGQPATWEVEARDDSNPFGSIQVSPCPPGGGVITLTYDDCYFPP